MLAAHTMDMAAAGAAAGTMATAPIMEVAGEVAMTAGTTAAGVADGASR